MESSILALRRNIEIIKAIETAIRFGGEIWQEDGSQRQRLQVLHIQTDLEQGQFIFDLEYRVQLNILLPVKIYFSYRKTQITVEPYKYKLTGHRLWINFPPQILALPQRTDHRIGFAEEMNLLVPLKHIDTNQGHVARLLDASEWGLGLIFPGINAETFSVGDKIQIEAIDQKLRGANVGGRIVYSIVDPLRNGSTHVGVRLEAPLSKSMIDYLARRGQLLSS